MSKPKRNPRDKTPVPAAVLPPYDTWFDNACADAVSAVWQELCRNSSHDFFLYFKKGSLVISQASPGDGYKLAAMRKVPSDRTAVQLVHWVRSVAVSLNLY